MKSDASELLGFMKQAIELRELSKFHFTRNLSDAIALIAKVGEQYNISREDLAYCDISCFRELHIAAGNPSRILLSSIERGKSLYSETLRTSLPL